MSVGTASTSQVAVLGAQGSVSSVPVSPSHARSTIRLVTFGALALYGTLKWSKLLSGGATARLLGLFVLAMLLAAGRPPLAARSRLVAAAATVAALLGALALAGVPLAWIVHVRIAVTAHEIGEGISALPQILVPYSGINQWVTLVIVLGAAVLLFDAALLVAFAPGAMAELRRAGAALPLVALAAVPTTLVRPAFPYLDGAVLFVLLVAFVWGERIGRRQIGGALGVCTVAVIAAMFAAPALDRHTPWFNYRGLAGSFGPGVIERFDWSQGYGPIDWPRKGTVVLEVQARHLEYWKAENLDTFAGVGWTLGTVPGTVPQPDASAIRRWTQTIQVTIRDMKTSEVIGAGDSERPADIAQLVAPGDSPGTWATGADLGPGDSYRVSVYAPDPTAAELTRAGTDYSNLPAGYRTILLPPSSGTPSPGIPWLAGEKLSGSQPELVFPPFHSGEAIESLTGPAGVTGATLLRQWSRVDRETQGSTYADAYRLAHRLAAGAATPFQFVRAVQRYLGHGYVYDEHPRSSQYPLTTFLMSSKHGYCQQFAGAMALLLRMGGVPARVAVGFTPGRLNTATGRWVVTDYDAHAWVEAWFPHYGWVRFDPTPVADPALGGHTPISAYSGTNIAGTGIGLSASKSQGRARSKSQKGSSRGRRPTPGFGATAQLPWMAALVAAVLLALMLVATKPLRSVEAMVGELEGAMRRIGRPLPGGATLTWVERRVGGSSDAAAYVRALRVARFGEGAGLPTSGQRRALRRQLRLGMGPLGALRAVWALPPRWTAPRTRAGWKLPRSRTRAGRT